MSKLKKNAEYQIHFIEKLLNIEFNLKQKIIRYSKKLKA